MTPSNRDMKPSRDIMRLLEIMAALRTPQTGCPWDVEQTYASIAPYTIEEAYEVAEAIARNDLDDLKDELGDLLLQVVFHARMAQEEAAFDFGGVVEAICTKMIRRHPHVFGERAGRMTPDEVKGLWGEIKAMEKAERAARHPDRAKDGAGVLDGVKAGLPTLARALELQKAAGTVGFDWNDPYQVLAKIREETDEIEAALKAGENDSAALETGDLMFAAVNLARHLKANPDTMLRATNAKFEQRFRAIEVALKARGQTFADVDLIAMERLWQAAKTHGAAD